jgi:LuxR family transcriptional regulator, maltose regulon positive regulatory protein
MKLDADPGIILKATPPRASKWLFQREGLSVARLELSDTPVISVSAPAGFGKTSLLSQWRREWLACGAVVAWLNLDEADDPVRFSESLAVAMSLGSGRGAFSRLSHRSALSDGEIDRLTEWLGEVAGLGVHTVLILDEAERLPSATADQSLVYLLSNLPANLQVVIAARTRLNLPVAELVGRGMVRRITTESLRFTLPETIALLQGRFGARLDRDACAKLHELSEGWPLGLQLAIAAVERSPNLRDMLELVSAKTGDIRHYFVDSLLSHLPSAQQEFLLRIAVVDRVHPALCAVLTGSPDAPAILEQLRNSTPIFAQGVDSEWLTIHSLAREFLLERFEQLPAQERERVHIAAADWLAERGMYADAARHALKAGREEAAWSLAERGLFELFEAGQGAAVIEWVDRLPPSAAASRPRLLLSAGYVRAMSRRYAEAEPYARRVLELPRVEPQHQVLAMLMLSAAAFYADQIDKAEAIVSDWLPLISGEQMGKQMSEHRANQTAMLALCHGNPTQALHLLQAQDVVPPGPGIDLAGGINLAIAGLAYLWQGQAAQAEATLLDGMQRAENIAGRRGAVAAVLAGPLALAQWLGGHTEAAATTLANRLDLIEYLSLPDGLIAAYVVGARLAALGNEERRAYSLLEELCVLGEARSMPRLCIASLAELIRMHAVRGRGETSASLLARLEAVFTAFLGAEGSILGGLMSLERQIAGGYVAIARRNWTHALETLEPAGQLADQLRRGRESITVKLLRGLALRATGADSSALMQEAIGLADAYGLRRILIDTHPDLAAAQTGLTARISAAQHPDQIRSVKGEVPRVTPSGLLTPKEQQVLLLLARRLSNKQIAAALDVGDATVKWHLKNLFMKLNVGTRDHALQRARVLGILEHA